MGELARSNMFYHAKGLELFSVPCAQISTLQARAHGEVVCVFDDVVLMPDRTHIDLRLVSFVFVA